MDRFGRAKAGAADARNIVMRLTHRGSSLAASRAGRVAVYYNA
ncbi:MAG: hypothetical protein AB7P12_13280 [Alphaproteobacteria bacterium]